MVTVVALFNLKPGVSVEQYEAWAGMYDLPTVRGLSSVQSFEILRAQVRQFADAPLFIVTTPI